MTAENVCPTGISVVVMGVSGAGKSTVGMALARRLDIAFADGDSFHPAANIAKMSAGESLDDDDRRPWLDAVGQWLADHSSGAISCSALKRHYRDQLRWYRTDVDFLQLTGPPGLIQRRQADRAGHYMPPSLMASQFDALEPLDRDERGLQIDVGLSVEAIVETFVHYLAVRP